MVTAKVLFIALAFGVVVWANCGAIMGIGPQFLSMGTTLVVHAIGGPLGAAVAAWIYYRVFGDLAPLGLAAVFVGLALVLDGFVVSPFFVGSYGMFGSPFGLWIPMALIFAATWLTGTLMAKRRPV
jgi:uncharacterized membrane protein YdfJ with MMPL/SSD domain